MVETKMIFDTECEVISNVTNGFELDSNPIVTVSVVTYNSSTYVVETLESIKSQTYHNIILQISDDFSTDDTVKVCSDWISKNQSRFVKTKIISPSRNTGVAANCNRSWYECETQYLKDIAGDDLLLKDCVESYMNYVSQNPDAIVVFGKALTFSTKLGKRRIRGYIHDYEWFKLSSEEIHKKLLQEGNQLPASSVFYNIHELKKMDFQHDTRIRNIEDYPKWIKLSRMGLKFHFFDKDTVLYRYEDTSLSVGLFSPNYYRQQVLLYLYNYIEEVRNNENEDEIYNLIADHCTTFYKSAYERATNSSDYKIGNLILKPIRFIKAICKYIKL